MAGVAYARGSIAIQKQERSICRVLDALHRPALESVGRCACGSVITDRRVASLRAYLLASISRRRKLLPHGRTATDVARSV